MKKFLFLITMVAFVSGSVFAQTDTTTHKTKHKKAKTSKTKTDKKPTTPM